MIVTTQQLKEKYRDYSNPIAKINRDIKQEKLFPLVRGVYETNPSAQGFMLAQFIYGPSYLSFEYVLSVNGLIPEAVYNTFTCATYNKRKIKTYLNKFGTYIYRDVPKSVFGLGISAVSVDNYSYIIASTEKALCDKLYTVSPVANKKELRRLLFEDLRIDEEGLSRLDKEDILKLAPLYRSVNLNFFAEFIKEGM